MKQVALSLILILLYSCGISRKEEKSGKNTGQTTQFEFPKEMHNFGTLQAGEIVVYTFSFTNTGTNNLWINEVDTGCGCMRADYPKEMVKPGKTGKIEVEFNSSGLFGKQMKSITVKANVPEPKHLAIFAEVKNKQLEINY